MTSPPDQSPHQPRPARIKDVAAATGVSLKTVSNVVHGKRNVGEDTRRRVLEAIDRLGYRPDPVGRQLRSGRSDTITLIVPEIVSPYFSELAHAIIQAARRSGLAVFIEETGGDPDIEQEVANSLTLRTFDGVIFSPLSADRHALQALQRKVPTVFLGEYVAGSDVDHLTWDNVAATEQATGHLLDIGRRRIAFLGAQHHRINHTADLRQQGYQAALTAAGIEPDPDLIISTASYQREPGASQTAGFLERHPEVDGLVCGNDLLAMGALFALRAAGLRVPGDVAVIGFDNIPEGQYSNPTLSTIAPHVDQLAEMTIRALVHRIDHPRSSTQRHTPGHHLIARESTQNSGRSRTPAGTLTG